MKATIVWCLLGFAAADLRQASQPKKAYKLLQQGGGRGSKNFVVGSGQKNDGTTDTETKGRVLYMEPSTFGYQGLKNQRKKNYDNFLRSNIDNEQDNRNFNNEPGRDHLPFRTYEAAVETKYPYKGAQPGDDDDSLQVNNVNVDTVVKVAPGEPRLTPLRWNNPHASEIEVNLWIMCANPPTIVPIKKPTCSGEGNQNNIIQWAIPADFNQVNWQACPSTQCFDGCKKAGDCVLQIYAHSVETRQYSTSVPIIVTEQTYPGQKLAYNPTPKDNDESANFAWPSSYDLQSMVTGKAAQNPGNRNGENTDPVGSLDDVRLCASSEREGVSPTGASVPHVQLKNVGEPAETLNSGTVHLYLCKSTAKQRAGEQVVDRVVFEVSSSADGAAFVPGPTKTENYSPFEMSSEDQFGGSAMKKVKATMKAYSGQSKVVTVLLNLSGNGKRWRFRRHLQNACPTGLPEPFPDPWMDLSKLKRETCLSAQDPHANYAKTQIQRAALHSDVANHAYQNSNYSPYSGQQHGEISRNLQAAAVVHMTSGNRGELGKNNLPNQVKKTLKQLNKQVNKIYKTYEKIANKIIDALAGQGHTNGNGINMGVQPLGESFRSAEKGATSTKRLKTTTYVPSFDTQGVDMVVVHRAIEQRTGGNRAKYADLLSAPKPGTNRRYIEIYTATMNQMLPAFAAAEKLGITYMQSVEMKPCSVLSPTLQSMSTGTNRQGTACCTGSLLDKKDGECGATLPDITGFQKRNANNKKDGGLYAARQFNLERYMTLYGCQAACLLQTKASPLLAAAVTKTSKGTCINFDAGPGGCVATQTVGATDCRACAGIFNNVAPASFSSQFEIGKPTSPKKELEKMIRRVQSSGDLEPFGNVLETDGAPLVDDTTAVCHTPSSFSCPGGEANFEADVEAGKCTEVESKKIDYMCDDGPCDNEPNSLLCRTAKAKCEVDPDSGEKCMPGSENDPCKGCVQTLYDGGNDVAVALTSLVVFAGLL